MANCTKIKYPNQWAATRALRAIVSKHAHSDTKHPVAIHLCEFCRAWHLTSKRPQGKKARQWNAWTASGRQSG